MSADFGDSVIGMKLFARGVICVKSSALIDGSGLEVAPLDLARDIVSEMGRRIELKRKLENEDLVVPTSDVVLERSTVIEDLAAVVSSRVGVSSPSGTSRTLRTASRIRSIAADRL